MGVAVTSLHSISAAPSSFPCSGIKFLPPQIPPVWVLPTKHSSSWTAPVCTPSIWCSPSWTESSSTGPPSGTALQGCSRMAPPRVTGSNRRLLLHGLLSMPRFPAVAALAGMYLAGMYHGMCLPSEYVYLLRCWVLYGLHSKYQLQYGYLWAAWGQPASPWSAPPAAWKSLV